MLARRQGRTQDSSAVGWIWGSSVVSSCDHNDSEAERFSAICISGVFTGLCRPPEFRNTCNRMREFLCASFGASVDPRALTLGLHA